MSQVYKTNINLTEPTATCRTTRFKVDILILSKIHFFFKML